MAYLIDTNIAIHARDSTDAVLVKLAEHDGEVLRSALSLAELQRGVYRDLTLRLFGRLGRRLCCAVCRCCRSTPQPLAYGRIVAQCGWARGRDYDRMIAAHAISSDPILVTSNKADFQDIPGLSMENWVV